MWQFHWGPTSTSVAAWSNKQLITSPYHDGQMLMLGPINLDCKSLWKLSAPNCFVSNAEMRKRRSKQCSYQRLYWKRKPWHSAPKDLSFRAEARQIPQTNCLQIVHGPGQEKKQRHLCPLTCINMFQRHGTMDSWLAGPRVGKPDSTAVAFSLTLQSQTWINLVWSLAMLQEQHSMTVQVAQNWRL